MRTIRFPDNNDKIGKHDKGANEQNCVKKANAPGTIHFGVHIAPLKLSKEAHVMLGELRNVQTFPERVYLENNGHGVAPEKVAHLHEKVKRCCFALLGKPLQKTKQDKKDVENY